MGWCIYLASTNIAIDISFGESPLCRDLLAAAAPPPHRCHTHRQCCYCGVEPRARHHPPLCVCVCVAIIFIFNVTLAKFMFEKKEGNKINGVELRDVRSTIAFYINLRRRLVSHFRPYLSIKYGLCAHSIKKQKADREATMNGGYGTRSNWYEIALALVPFRFLEKAGGRPANGRQRNEIEVNKEAEKDDQHQCVLMCTVHVQNLYIYRHQRRSHVLRYNGTIVWEKRPSGSLSN